MALNIILAFLCLLSVTWADSDEDFKAGDKLADLSSTRYQVAIYYHINKTSMRFLCSGALIDKNWIITAASCTQAIPAPKLRLVMGPEDLVFEQKALNNTKNYYDVFYKVEHLLFDKAKKPQNICLIRTKLNIEFNAQVQPIERYKWDHDIEGSVTITDWNWRELDRSVQRKLRTLTLETLPRKKCRHLLKSDFNWAYMCVKIPEDDNFCDFEAGAPVVQNNKLVGITNYGPKCANGEPYIITLSYSYEDLIRTKLLGCGNACPTLDNFYILEVDL